VYRKFISIFLSKLPDRLAYLIIVVSIISLASFAYDNVGFPIGTASAETISPNVAATNTAVSWINIQPSLGDRINSDSIKTTTGAMGNGLYHVTVDFSSLEYNVDATTGGIHHISANHTLDMLVSGNKVVSAVENMCDLLNNQANSPLADLSRASQ